MKVQKKHFITNASLGANFTSEVIDVEPVTTLGLYLNATGDFVGTVRIQCTINGGLNWPDVDEDVLNLAVDGSGIDEPFDIDTKAFEKIRIFVERTSGSGTLNGWWIQKELD